MNTGTTRQRLRGRRLHPVGQGALSPTAEMEVAAEENAMGVDPSRGHGRGRGSRRGGRRNHGPGSRGRLGHERPGPYSIEHLVVCEILEMPQGEAIALDERRVWQSSSQHHASPPSLPLAASPPPTSSGEEVGGGDVAPTSSPVMCVSPSTSSAIRPRPRQNRRDKNISDHISYGSDSGSDESDEDEGLVFPSMSRVHKTIMETPLDRDTYTDPSRTEYVTQSTEPAELASVPPMMTYQPWSCYDFDWRAFPETPISPKSRREPFSQNNVGPTTPRDDPYDIFVDIWDRQIMEHIASETNRYAQQVAAQLLDSHNLQPRSRISQWHDTTADELYVYFAIMLAMGIVVKSRLEEYWSSTPDIFFTPGFNAHMALDRFGLLNKCIHFNNNENMSALELDGSEARLYKIQPLLTHLNMKFQTLYTPAQNIVLDESLLMWKGWLDIGQHIPDKATNGGIKTFEVCESQTGYLWRFEVHAHKKTPPQQFEDPVDALIPSTVLRLTKGLEHKGYTLWMDSYYTSPCLARRLKSLGFDCVGTLRTNREFVPQTLHRLTSEDMHPGQVFGLTSGDVDIMLWKDINRIATISTYHGNALQTVRGSTKPILILDYNIMIGGVDKKDQLLAMYPVERKRTKVWYKKLFRRLLNISVLNSYIIHHHTSSLSHRNFRISLVKSLLYKHRPDVPLIPEIPQHQRIDVSHHLDEYPWQGTQRRRRNCVVCRKRTCTFCVACCKSVCLKPCFMTLHS